MERTGRKVRDHIAAAIEEGRLPPGARLPTERALCETLSVSRSAVRTALGMLEGEGRIIRVAGSGSYVSDRDGPGSRIELGKLVSPAQVMDARLTLEPPLAHLVAANGAAADFHRLRECVEKGAQADQLEQFEYWDAAFHERIADATHNPLVKEAYRLITRARDQAEWGELKRRSLTPERRDLYQGDHERILQALEQRSASAAEKEIRSHLVRVRGNLLTW